MIDFLSWYIQPAVLIKTKTWYVAYVMDDTRGEWRKINADDAIHNGGLMNETEWRARFEKDYGPLDLSKIPPH